MIVMKRSFLNEDGTVGPALLKRVLELHSFNVRRLQKLADYDAGKHDILNREFTNTDIPNVKVVCNHAAYIKDMAVAYVHGEPVQYSCEDEALQQSYLDWCTEVEEDCHNFELGDDIGVFGYGLEYVYMSTDETPIPKLACLSPLNSFLVVDDTVEHKEMFAVTVDTDYDISGNVRGYNISVSMPEYYFQYYSTTLLSNEYELVDIQDNPFGEVQVIEYQNNKKEIGDFEPVISLIDAYNLLESDRISDKEQFVDSFLVLINQMLGDDMAEKVETIKALREMKVLEIDQDGDAKWLTKTLTESDVEVLRMAIKSDIHEFSKVPDMTDQNFVGNASGVAMKYKLLGLEQKGNTKERYFKKGLRKRLKLLDKINYIRGANTNLSVDMGIKMERSLPVDTQERINVAQAELNILSKKSVIERYDPEIDVNAEMEQKDAETQQDILNAQQSIMAEDYENFGGGNNGQYEDGEEGTINGDSDTADKGSDRNKQRAGKSSKAAK